MDHLQTSVEVVVIYMLHYLCIHLWMFETFSQLLLFDFLKEKQKPRTSQGENLLKYYLNKQ